MRIGSGNRSTRKKPAQVPFCSKQIPQNLEWDQTRSAAMGDPRITAWALERPVVDIATSLQARRLTNWASILSRGKSFFSSPQPSAQPWGPPSLN
jgi:hypothetical protein